MTPRIGLLTALLVLGPGTGAARADLSFVQIVQAQSDAGKDGLFGKSWVEVLGRRMRLVSGYARKVVGKERPAEPRRVIQILDLDARDRTLIHPEEKRYSREGLGELDYGNRMRGVLDRGAAKWSIASSDISIKERSQKRRFLNAECTHHHVVVKMVLRDSGGREENARMDQHVWVAPVSGDLAKNLMDLIAFENSYRAATGGSLSPLDHERYQVREAAAYLRVEEGELNGVVGRVRESLRDLPSYPVASSVSWYRVKPREKPPEPAAEPQRGPEPESPEDVSRTGPEQREPRERRQPRFEMGRSRGGAFRSPGRLGGRPGGTRGIRSGYFQPINWRSAELRINRLYREARWRANRASDAHVEKKPVVVRSPEEGRDGADGVPLLYDRFEAELHAILAELIAEEGDAITAESKGGASQRPFYEIYAELHGLEDDARVDPGDFLVPPEYRETASAGQ